MTSITGQGYLDTLGSGGAKAAPNGTLDQNSFLTLMTTQLKTQDPFDPVDNTQMVAQMAQFSQVSGIAEMNQSLKSMADDLASARIGNVATWIGKAALVGSSTATPLADGSYAFEAELPEDATNVQIDLVDASGAVVHSQNLGAESKGTLGYSWDAKDEDGNSLATGPLKVMVTAYGAEGAMETTISSWTMINGVQSPAAGGAAQLITPLGIVKPEEAMRLA
ncbi:flagellar basal-body rod modification protein FlgD [Sphingomonas laterariae]|uniref:Basal-body rod modification protein FlgD n=1 Tax=Edaphosphingomonas laterariae TaxID=861865 RepID=A0A239HTM5_9SPHN|nr:flagellar hook capping FlgD N-terminal domain-containing protein [Sphingomonas laterariae]SNS84438.1 flagellar basal-body rod modification protein FlgD [Sphingomonas laterariae]